MKRFNYVNQYFTTNGQMTGSFGAIGLEDVDFKKTDAFVEYTAYLDVLRILEFVPLEKLVDAYRIIGETDKANLLQSLIVELQERNEDLITTVSRDCIGNSSKIV